MKEINFAKADVEQLRKIAQIDQVIEQLREDKRRKCQEFNEEIQQQLRWRAEVFEEIQQMSLPL